MRRLFSWRIGCLVVASLLIWMGSDLVRADQSDPTLQGRILQRSDGVLYLYKDGVRYLVRPANLTDAQINAIPESSPAVDRLDIPMAQSAVVLPPPVSDSAQTASLLVPPSAPPSPPPPGTVLYQANWSSGADGWSGSADWKILNGMLINDGTGSERSAMIAPYSGSLFDYAIEATLQKLRGGDFGLFLRRDGRSGYTFRAGMVPNGWRYDLGTEIATEGGEGLGSKVFNPGTDWHTYRFEARGNNLRLLVDNNLMAEAADNRYLTGSQAGIWASAAQLNVRGFRIIAL